MEQINKIPFDGDSLQENPLKTKEIPFDGAFLKEDPLKTEEIHYGGASDEDPLTKQEATSPDSDQGSSFYSEPPREVSSSDIPSVDVKQGHVALNLNRPPLGKKLSGAERQKRKKAMLAGEFIQGSWLTKGTTASNSNESEPPLHRIKLSGSAQRKRKKLLAAGAGQYFDPFYAAKKAATPGSHQGTSSNNAPPIKTGWIHSSSVDESSNQDRPPLRKTRLSGAAQRKRKKMLISSLESEHKPDNWTNKNYVPMRGPLAAKRGPSHERSRPPHERPGPSHDRRRPPHERPRPPHERPRLPHERPGPSYERPRPPHERSGPLHGRPGPPHETPGPPHGRPGPQHGRPGPQHGGPGPQHGGPGPLHGGPGPLHGGPGPQHRGPGPPYERSGPLHGVTGPLHGGTGPPYDRSGPPYERPGPPYARPVPSQERPGPPYARPVPSQERPGPPYARPGPSQERPGPSYARHGPPHAGPEPLYARPGPQTQASLSGNTPPFKRPRAELRPGPYGVPESAMKSLRDDTRPGGSGDAPTTIKMTIIKEGYPDERIVDGEIPIIQEEILRKLDGMSFGQPLPLLKHFYLADGALVYLCGSQETCQWLIRNIDRFHLGDGSILKVIRAKNFSQPIKVAFRTRDTCTVDTQKLLLRLQTFNPELRTENWTVHQSSAESHGQRVILSVDKDSADSIRNAGYKAFTGIDQGTFKFLSDPGQYPG